MPLSGHTRELSLPDLVQLQSLSRSTCRIEVRGPAGRGWLMLDSGTVVDADYGGLQGEPAAYALLAEDDLHYEVRRDAEPQRRSMEIGAQGLVLEAMRRKDEGELPKVTSASPAAPAESLRPATPPEPRAATPGPAVQSARAKGGPGPVLVAAVAAAVVLLLGVVGFFLLRPGQPAAPTTEAAPEPAAGAPAPPREPVDAAELTGPRDAVPELVTGSPPASPDPGAPLQPTIVVRLLIDAEGRVAEARVYRPRPDLAAFEERALEVVEAWRFTPGRREGVAVPVRINWPVQFD